jgi:hypothetical protein
MHEHNVSTLWAAISAFLSLIFGIAEAIAIGVLFGALAGSFLSIRFCEPKSTLEQAWHVFLSTALACMITGGVGSVWKEAPLQMVAIGAGLIVLIVAEKIYNAAKEISLKELWDKVVDKWTR